MAKTLCIIVLMLLAACPVGGQKLPRRVETAYRVEFGKDAPWSWKFFWNVVYHGRWKSIRAINTFDESGERAIALTNKAQTFGYLDRTHPERWAIYDPGNDKEPMPLTREALEKIHSLFTFFDRSDTAVGNEQYVTFLYTNGGGETKYYTVLVVITALEVTDLTGKERTLAWRFTAHVYKSNGNLSRNGLSVALANLSKFPDVKESFRLKGYIGAGVRGLQNVVDAQGIILHIAYKEKAESRKNDAICILSDRWPKECTWPEN